MRLILDGRLFPLRPQAYCLWPAGCILILQPICMVVSQIGLVSHNMSRQTACFLGVPAMTYKRYWFWLLLLAIGISGCEKSRPANQSATIAKEKPVQDRNAPAQKLSSLVPGDKITPGVSRTPDMPSYQLPADFKLPLEITMEASEAPKEIQNPSPPIEEKK